MSRHTIIVNIHAKEEKTDFIRQKLLSLIDRTRAEEGCVVFDLHENNEAPSHFVFYEIWETRALWLEHMDTAFFKDYKASITDSIEGIGFYEMTQIA